MKNNNKPFEYSGNGNLKSLAVLPAYETMGREMLKWKKAKQLTCLLFPCMGID